MNDQEKYLDLTGAKVYPFAVNSFDKKDVFIHLVGIDTELVNLLFSVVDYPGGNVLFTPDVSTESVEQLTNQQLIDKCFIDKNQVPCGQTVFTKQPVSKIKISFSQIDLSSFVNAEQAGAVTSLYYDIAIADGIVMIGGYFNIVQGANQ